MSESAENHDPETCEDCRRLRREAIERLTMGLFEGVVAAIQEEVILPEMAIAACTSLLATVLVNFAPEPAAVRPAIEKVTGKLLARIPEMEAKVRLAKHLRDHPNEPAPPSGSIN